MLPSFGNTLLLGDLIGLLDRKSSCRSSNRIILGRFQFSFLIHMKVHLRLKCDVALEREVRALDAELLLLVAILVDRLLAREVGRRAALITLQRLAPLVERIAAE